MTASPSPFKGRAQSPYPWSGTHGLPYTTQRCVRYDLLSFPRPAMTTIRHYLSDWSTRKPMVSDGSICFFSLVSKGLTGGVLPSYRTQPMVSHAAEKATAIPSTITSSITKFPIRGCVLPTLVQVMCQLREKEMSKLMCFPIVTRSRYRFPQARARGSTPQGSRSHAIL